MGVDSKAFIMLVSLCVLVVLPWHGQAAPTESLVVLDTPEVRQAKAEFMESFTGALTGLLSELAPAPVQDTAEVAEAKQEFLTIFESAVDGVVETVFRGDTQDVKEYKEKFFKTFNSAVTDLFVTVEGIYTPAQAAARRKFHQAYKDAEEGSVGAQYQEDTAEVKAAKERFFEFFQLVLDGMLHKIAPQPGNNIIPEEIADFYIKDEPDVAAEKLEFDELYRDALNGDAASALAVSALEQAISNNQEDMEAAAKELEETLDAIADVVEEEYSDDADSDLFNEDDLEDSDDADSYSYNDSDDYEDF